MSGAYTMAELMAVVLARDLKDGEKGLTGLASSDRTGMLVVGIPLAAMGLAQRMHAPNLTILYGGIIVNPRLDEITMLDESGAGLHRLRADAQLSLEDTLSLARRGEIDFGFSAGAQVDRYGNANITCLGPYEQPRVRLVGSVLQTEHFSLFGREYMVMAHRRRHFVERVDFITGAGYLDSAHAREQAGLNPSGPRWVVTDLAVLGFNAATKRMQLESLHAGVSLEQVQEQTGFQLLIPDPIPATARPTAEELDLLRHQVDPHGRLLPRSI
jgi:glutaconate CoA-transferase subunit B